MPCRIALARVLSPPTPDLCSALSQIVAPCSCISLLSSCEPKSSHLAFTPIFSICSRCRSVPTPSKPIGAASSIPTRKFIVRRPLHGTRPSASSLRSRHQPKHSTCPSFRRQARAFLPHPSWRRTIFPMTVFSSRANCWPTRQNWPVFPGASYRAGMTFCARPRHPTHWQKRGREPQCRSSALQVTDKASRAWRQQSGPHWPTFIPSSSTGNRHLALLRS